MPRPSAPQDALEFFQYLLELMTRAERAAGVRLGCDAGGAPTADAFAYQLEDRKQVRSPFRLWYHCLCP